VGYKIPEILPERKVQEGALILAVCLLGGVSFGLGRLSVGNSTHEPVALCTTIPAAPVAQTATAVNALANTGAGQAQNTQKTSTQGQYVASKTGTVYHLPWCSGAKRIKDANKVWFDTKQAAEAAGYRPATNCKGL